MPLKPDINEKLYIEATVSCGADTAVAVISGSHTDFVYIAKNDTVIYEKPCATDADATDDDSWLTLRKVYDFATSAPLDEIGPLMVVI